MTTDIEESEEDRVRRARARDPGPGLLGLARRLHDSGMQSFGEIDRDWLNDAGAEFFERAGKLAADLRDRATLGTEIEVPTVVTSGELPNWLKDVMDREVELRP